MIDSYVAKTTIDFISNQFYIRPGDLLVHDTANHKLIIHRNGEIVKVVKQESLGIFAFIKSGFIEKIPDSTEDVVVEPILPLKSKAKKATPILD